MKSGNFVIDVMFIDLIFERILFRFITEKYSITD